MPESKFIAYATFSSDDDDDISQKLLDAVGRDPISWVDSYGDHGHTTMEWECETRTEGEEIIGKLKVLGVGIYGILSPFTVCVCIDDVDDDAVLEAVGKDADVRGYYGGHSFFKFKCDTREAGEEILKKLDSLECVRGYFNHQPTQVERLMIEGGPVVDETLLYLQPEGNC